MRRGAARTVNFFKKRIRSGLHGAHGRVRRILSRPASAGWLNPSGSLPRDFVTVAGWALANGSVPKRVELFVDGRSQGLARLGLPRPDVARHFRRRRRLRARLTGPDPIISGFECRLDLSRVPREAAHIELTARAECWTGTSFTLPPALVPLTPDNASEGVYTRPTQYEAHVRRKASSPTGLASAAIRMGVFTHNLDIGGAQHYLLDLLQRLTRESDLCACIVSPQDGPLRERLDDAGIPVYITDGYPTDGIEDYEAKLSELARWASAYEVNTVLVNTFGAFLGVDVANILAVPCIWAIHESYSPEAYWPAAYAPGLPPPLIRRRAISALNQATAVMFEAEATRRLYEPYGRPERMFTVPYGIDLTAVESFRASFDRSTARRLRSIPEDAILLLCMGTVEPRKAQTSLVKAFWRVSEAFPQVYLAICGAGRDLFSDTLRTYVKHVGLADRVIIIPVTTDPLPWFGMADVFVSASDLESLPISILEAMAFEIPVLSTDVFGVSEIITDGETGYLVPPRDLGLLSHGLKEVLGLRPEQRRAIGQSGACVVRASHDADAYARRFTQALRMIVSDPDLHPSALERVFTQGDHGRDNAATQERP